MHAQALLALFTALVTTSAALPAAATTSGAGNANINTNNSPIRRTAQFDGDPYYPPPYPYGYGYPYGPDYPPEYYYPSTKNPESPDTKGDSGSQVHKRAPAWFTHGRFWKALMGPQADADTDTDATTNERLGKRDPYLFDNGRWWTTFAGIRRSDGETGGVGKRDAGPHPYWFDHGPFWPGVTEPYVEADKEEVKGSADESEGVGRRGEEGKE